MADGVLVVAGGAGGIGLACALAMADDHRDVAPVDCGWRAATLDRGHTGGPPREVGK
jgi:NAD(P)-dependent dehydrogenase (short-subunit alcohol dehydrogenase family)